MRAVRAVFYALLPVGLIGGLLTGERGFFLMLFVQLFVLVLCVALNLWTVANFSYVQTIDREELTKGETLVLHLRIHNDMPYPFTMMRVHVSAISPREDAVYSFALPAHGSIEFNPRFTCAFSGRSEVGMNRVEIVDALGLTRLSVNMLRLSYYRRKSVLIYPRVHRLAVLFSYSPDEKRFVGMGRNAAPSGDNFSGLREYRPGDAQKRIHWKASIRTRKLHTRVYERASETSCVLCVDPCLYGKTAEEARLYTDLLCEAAATIAYHALASGNAVRVLRADAPQNAVSATGPGDFAKAHRFLALLEFTGQNTGAPPLAFAAQAAVQESCGSAYLFTLGDANAAQRALQNAPVPNGGVTVFCASDTKRAGSVTGGIRTITATLSDGVACVLEGLL